MSKFEYRVHVSADMVGARWKSEWEPWEGDEKTEEEIVVRLDADTLSGAPSIAFETALEVSGLNWWAEVREVGGDE